MSNLFYLNTTLESTQRYNTNKFLEFIDYDYDLLRSYFFNKVIELQVIGTFRTSLEHRYAPDLLSFDIYGTHDLWEILLAFNNLPDFTYLKENMIINFFNLSDLEDLYFSLKSNQQSNETDLDDAQTIVISDNNTVESGIIAEQETAPDDTSVIWKKPNSTTLFIFDALRQKWLSTFSNNYISARGFSTISDSYLLGNDGQATNIMPFISPYNMSIVQGIFQTLGAETYIFEIRDSVETVLLSININSSEVVNLNNLDLDLDTNDSISFYINGQNINNPKATLYYKERG